MTVDCHLCCTITVRHDNCSNLTPKGSLEIAAHSITQYNDVKVGEGRRDDEGGCDKEHDGARANWQISCWWPGGHGR